MGESKELTRRTFIGTAAMGMAAVALGCTACSDGSGVSIANDAVVEEGVSGEAKELDLKDPSTYPGSVCPAVGQVLRLAPALRPCRRTIG